MFYWNIQKNSVIWDSSMYKLYEVNENDFAGAYSAWESTLHPDDKLFCNEAFKNAIEEKKDIDLIFRLITPLQKIKSIHSLDNACFK